MTRTAFVTGAGQGIGEAIALRLAEDGCDVVVADLPHQRGIAGSVVEQIARLGRRAEFVPLDVTDRDAVVDSVDRVARDWDGLDVMVNNAGIAQIKSIVDVTPDDLDTVLSVNVAGVLWGIQAAAAAFVRQGTPGRVISAASIVAHKGFPLLGAYSASKFAVKALTQVAAQEFAKHGITVNAYAPGIVGTAMWDQIDTELGKINGLAPGENMRNFSEGIALGRVETPRDVAGLVSYLASADAEYLTGQTILIDGGMLYV